MKKQTLFARRKDREKAKEWHELYKYVRLLPFEVSGSVLESPSIAASVSSFGNGVGFFKMGDCS